MEENAMIKAGRDFIKDVPDEAIIEESQKRYPQLVSQALSGDIESMMELFENFTKKAEEFAEDGHIHEAKILFSTGVFWYDMIEDNDE